MLKDNLHSRVFIRAAIWLLRLITPLSAVYLPTHLLLANRAHLNEVSRTGQFVLYFFDFYASSEVLFYLSVYLPRRWYLNRPAPPWNPLPTAEDRKLMFEKTWSATRNPRGYLSLWFKQVDVEALYRDDVKDWIHWRLWNGTLREPEHEPEVEGHTQRLEQILDLAFYDSPPGRRKYKPMKVTIEPLRMAHRPLLWYQLLVSAVDVQAFCHLKLYGYRYFAPRSSIIPRAFPLRLFSPFVEHRTPAKHLSYFYRPHKCSTCLPVVFVHGIGVGLSFYLAFLSQFATEFPDVGIIALEILPVSSRITHAPLHPEVMASEVHTILMHHGWDYVCLTTHSYGSVIAAQLLHSTLTAPLLGPLFFIDPVTFSFHTPEVAWNFLRRKPMSASEHQLQYFASLDPGVAQALTRSFVWTDNSLWREDVEGRGERCTVALSGKDIITDTETLGAYLTRTPTEGMEWYEEPEEWQTDDWKREPWTGSCDLEVIYFEELNHAEAFDGKQERDRLFEVIRTYIKQS